jgi:hypothetical protein
MKDTVTDAGSAATQGHGSSAEAEGGAPQQGGLDEIAARNVHDSGFL